MAPEGTVPASLRVTDWPAAREARVQVSVAEVKVTPDGRFGLVMLVKPWVGQGVDHAQVGGVGRAPSWRPRRCRCRWCRPRPRTRRRSW